MAFFMYGLAWASKPALKIVYSLSTINDFKHASTICEHTVTSTQNQNFFHQYYFQKILVILLDKFTSYIFLLSLVLLNINTFDTECQTMHTY